MTEYEIIMIFLGILAILISFGDMLIALLTFLGKRYGKKNEKRLSCGPDRIGDVRKDK